MTVPAQLEALEKSGASIARTVRSERNPMVELYPHQQKAVDQLGNGKILWGGVGTGKSITSLAYFVSKVCKGTYGDFGSMRTPKDVYIITTAKKRDSLDWDQEAIKFGISRDRDSSVSGVQMTVDSWNNISKYEGVSGAFFIFDEQRLVGSGAWTKAFIKIAKSNEWILLSATPGDTWLDYIPVFVANGWYKNRTEFKRRHVVYSHYGKFPKVDRYVEAGTLVKRRNQLLVHMPYARHTIRHGKDVLVEHDKVLFNKVVNERWHVYEERPLQNITELFSVMRKVVNSDSSRLEQVRQLLLKHPRLIVFYNFDYELEELRKLAPTSSGSTFTTTSCSTESTVETVGKSSSHEGFWTEDDGNGEMWIPAGTFGEDGFQETDYQNPSSSNETKSLARGTTDTAVPATPDSTDVTRVLPSGAYSTKTNVSTSERLTSQGASFSGTGTDLSNPVNGLGQTLSQSTESQDAGALDAKSGRSQAQIADGLTVAEWNGHKHEPVPTTDRWLYLVQYRAGAEGWNCVETNAMCFYSLTYSWKDYFQAHGRIDRLNTPFVDLWYYSLVSDSMIDKAISRALKAKKSFNEKDLPVEWS